MAREKTMIAPQTNELKRNKNQKSIISIPKQ